MRSLRIAVLSSLVSSVVAFSKRGHTLRNTHTRSSRCYAKTDGVQNQTQNQTVTDEKQNRPAAIGMGYRPVDQYKGQDFLDEA
jgi:hypothetical protein